MSSELHEKAVDELEQRERELYDQLFKLRFQVATNQLENPGKVRLVRKDLARVKTILNLKRREASRTDEKAPAQSAPKASAEESR